MVKNTDPVLIVFISCIFGLVAPLIIMPLEKIFPYPFIVEEIVKVIFVMFIISLNNKLSQLKLAIIVALLFATSENIFYLSNFITDDIVYSFLQRFILTTTLHVLTMMIILFSGQKNKRYLILGLFIAILFHCLYNHLIGSFL